MDDNCKTKEQLIIEERTSELITLNEQLESEINKREQAEEELDHFFNLSLDIFGIANFEYYFKRVNPAFEKTLGYTKGELLAKPYIDFIHPEDQAVTLEAVQELATGIPMVNFENRYICKDGSYKWLAWTGMPNIEKRLNHFVARDITERKRSEDTLRELKEQYQNLVNDAPVGVCISQDDIYRFVNPKLADIFGYSVDELIGKRCPLDLVHPDDIPMVRENNRQQLNGKAQSIDYTTVRGVKKDGSVVELTGYDSLTMFQGRPAIQGILLDITERNQAERLFKTLTNCSPVGIFIVQDGKFQFINPQFQKYTGYSEEELLGVDSLSFVLPEDRNKVKVNAINMLKGKRSSPYEYRFTQKSGEIRWILETVTSIQYKGKRAVLGNYVDITQRKRAEKMLRLSEERFSKAFNASPNPMTISSIADGLLIDVNKSFLRVLGYSCHEVIGRTVKELNIYADHSERAKIVQELLKQGIVHNFEAKLRTKLGEERIGLISADIIEINSEQCLLGVINDITERRQMQKEIARLDRLNLVGEMAAGIGHEIRNPMTTVRGFLQILEGKEEFVNHKEYLTIMIDELDRVNSIITEYLSMAKNKAVDLKYQNLNSVVETIFPLIQADAMNADKYVEMEPAELPYLLVDEKEMRQLILNLVRNGLEAMSPGGKITIRTFIDDGNVVLSVQDQGTGIEPELLEKIGTPFFTTKENGTGLGLSVCYSIAARHNAAIDIKTSFNGTTILVRFKRDGKPK
ncbi:MAG: PAS domain S-box protein [Desulfotomaculaceae bacterium]|nr:PAS domain S-box protein [Desulfotomaculaceae bacterium]